MILLLKSKTYKEDSPMNRDSRILLVALVVSTVVIVALQLQLHRQAMLVSVQTAKALGQEIVKTPEPTVSPTSAPSTSPKASKQATPSATVKSATPRPTATPEVTPAQEQ